MKKLYALLHYLCSRFPAEQASWLVHPRQPRYSRSRELSMSAARNRAHFPDVALVGGSNDVSFRHFTAQQIHFSSLWYQPLHRDFWLFPRSPTASPIGSRSNHGQRNRIGGLPDSFHEFQSGRCVLVEYTDKKHQRQDNRRVGLQCRTFGCHRALEMVSLAIRRRSTDP